MKKDLSVLEIHYLVKEFQELKGARVSKILQPQIKEIVFDIFVSGKGKRLLTLSVPNFIYLASSKKESPQNPLQFCSTLRKYLMNSILDNIEQIDSERIVKLVFKTKENVYHLYAELFSKGNVILCDEKDVIISAVEKQKWKARIVKRGEKYVAPKREVGIFDLKESELKKIMDNTTKDSLIVTLATELGIGGFLSEEICFCLGIAKEVDARNLDAKKIKDLYDIIVGIVGKKIDAKVIKKENMLIDAVPFEMESYKGFENISKDSFNSALDYYIKNEFLKTEGNKSKYDSQIKGMLRLIEKQEEQLKKIEKGQAENKEKGELIYENYQAVEEILTQLEKARGKFSWKEIKEKLKGHKTIKQINEKEGKIVIEL